MRALKLALIGAFVIVVAAAVGAVTIIHHARPHNRWRVGRLDELVGRVNGVVHASQARRVSPHESTSGTVDGSEVTITYGRPTMRGREIFGRLVPYGRVWCPGADEATTFDSQRDVKIGTLLVPAGPHTIWMLPTREAWTLIVSKEPSGFHTNYIPSLDLGRVPLTKRMLDAPVEQLTFEVATNPAGGGVLKMSWETTEVSAPFTVQ